MPIAVDIAVMPALGWLVLVLSIYALVFVPVVLWGLSRANHRGLGWVVLTFFSLVLSAGLWLYVHQQVMM